MAIVPIKKIQQKMEAKINNIDYIILGYLLTEWATLPARDLPARDSAWTGVHGYCQFQNHQQTGLWSNQTSNSQ